MKRNSIITALILLVLAGCSGQKPVTPRSGDLVFVGIPMNYSLDRGSMSEAISAATSDSTGLNLIHVAILETAADSTWIIDATIKRGVDRHPLDTFIRDFTLRDGTLPTFMLMRPDASAAEAEQFVRNAKKYLGQPYDVYFLPDNGAMYCSELVYNSYITPSGERLFSEAPMNFLDKDGNMPQYWTQLFARLGEEVPQGIPGTNPQKMATEKTLSPLGIELR